MRNHINMNFLQNYITLLYLMGPDLFNEIPSRIDPISFSKSLLSNNLPDYRFNLTNKYTIKISSITKENNPKNELMTNAAWSSERCKLDNSKAMAKLKS